MTARPFAVRPSGSRFYPWEWECLLHVADDHGDTKPCRVKRLTKGRAEAEAMATAHHNNLHPEPPARPRAPEDPAPPHSCRNCEGIDPSSCLTNPDRPAGGA